MANNNIARFFIPRFETLAAAARGMDCADVAYLAEVTVIGLGMGDFTATEARTTLRQGRAALTLEMLAG